ncbi:MAG: OsmC family protein [candidate division WOR-3 bacterium]
MTEGLNRQMHATLRWVHGMQFVATAGSNHGVVLDTGADHGGTDTGTTPMELVLDALAGCTAMDVVSILRKMRVEFRSFIINVRAERADEHPKVFTRIQLEYVVSGVNLDETKIRQAVELSQTKYCSVSAMLKKACPVEWTVRVEEAT